MQELIDGEDKANPCSDEELVRRMHEAGYPVARRTVTKYRKQLAIPSSRQRKDWTAVEENGSHGAHAPAPAAEPDNVTLLSPPAP
jgi:hypothetical protein